MSQVPRYLRINESDSLVRDTYSMGVINTSNHALEVAKRKQKEAMKRVTDEQRYKLEINTLRSEVAELKELLLQVLKKEK